MEKIICPNCGHDMIDKSVGDAIEAQTVVMGGLPMIIED